MQGGEEEDDEGVECIADAEQKAYLQTCLDPRMWAMWVGVCGTKYIYPPLVFFFFFLSWLLVRVHGWRIATPIITLHPAFFFFY